MRHHLPPELMTGIAAIDDAHDDIFRMFREVLKACDQGRGREKIDELFAFLDGYVEDHFRLEERSQLEAAYPLSREHADEHRAFQRKVAELKEMFEQHGRSVNLLIKSLRILARWLFEHVEVADRGFSTYLLSRNSHSLPDPVDTVVTEA